MPSRSLAGARIVITGTSSGIGRAAVVAFAAQGAHVIALQRSAEPGFEPPAAPGRIDIVACDLARPALLRACAATIGESPVDVVISNAGVERWSRTATADGVELTMATNVLAHLVLVETLRPALAASRLKCVIGLGSMVHRWGRIDWSDMESARRYEPQAAYAASKTALALLQGALARRLAADGVSVHTLDPGMTRTRFARDFGGFAGFMARLLRPVLRAPEAVAEELLALAGRDDLLAATGACWKRGRRIAPAASTQAPEAQLRMLAWCRARLAGLGVEIAD
jgi:NAD(P)-dependent dehydrogenase (short-subunit alcohol dehydrogenase family)